MRKILRAWLAFLFAVLSALVLAALTGNFLALYGLGILFWYCASSVVMAPFSIHVTQEMDKATLFKGEALTCSITIRNRSLWLYPPLTCIPHSDGALRYQGLGSTVSLPPLRRNDFPVQIHCPYRGIYPCGIAQLVVRDQLGLFQRRIVFPNPTTVAVFPLVDDSFALSIRQEGQGVDFRHDRFLEDYTTVADIRTHTPSDSLRKVHWKLSAKRGELVVKNFQSFEPNPTVLFLDTSAPPLSGKDKAEWEDLMVSYAASAIQYCAMGRLPATFLCSGGEHIVEADPAGDLEKVLQVLAPIRFDRPESGLPALCYEIGGGEGENNLIAFVSGIRKEEFDALREIISLGHTVLLYRFHSPLHPVGTEEQTLLDSLEAFGAGTIFIPVE